MRCWHLQQHGWIQRLSYKWSKSDRERQIYHLVGSKEIMQVSLFTKQKQTHRHRKQTWLPRGKVRRGMTNYEFKNTLKWSEVKWKSLNCVLLLVTPWLYSPWNSPGQNAGVGSLSLLQGILPTQGSNLGLQHCRWILYQLSHKRSPIYMYVKWSESCSVDRYATILKVEK